MAPGQLHAPNVDSGGTQPARQVLGGPWSHVGDIGIQTEVNRLGQAIAQLAHLQVIEMSAQGGHRLGEAGLPQRRQVQESFD
jgi:hypothetical protein